MSKASKPNYRWGILATGDALVILFNLVYLLISLVILCTTATSSTSYFIEMQKKMPIWGIDYIKHASMGNLAMTNPKGLYDLDVQRQWMQERIDPVRYKDITNLNPSYYTPPLCTALIPFSLLPLEKGYILWLLLQIIVAIVLVTKASTHRMSRSEWCYFWFLILSSPGPRQSIFLGQTGFLMTALLAGVYICWCKNKEISGGALLAMAALVKPHHCLVAMIMFLVKRQWRAIISFIMSSFVLYGLSALVVGPSVVLGYPRALDTIERASYAHKYYVPLDICINIRGILSYFLDAEQAHLIGLVILAFCVAAIFLIWRRALAAGPSTYGLALFTTMSIALIGNLHANFYDLTMLAVPFAASVGAVGFVNSINKPHVENRLWVRLLSPLLDRQSNFIGNLSVQTDSELARALSRTFHRRQLVSVCQNVCAGKFALYSIQPGRGINRMVSTR